MTEGISQKSRLIEARREMVEFLKTLPTEAPSHVVELYLNRCRALAEETIQGYDAIIITLKDRSESEA